MRIRFVRPAIAAAAIIGDANAETATKPARTAVWHRFHELRKRLRRYGLHLGKRLDAGASWLDARLVFSYARLRAFVQRSAQGGSLAVAGEPAIETRENQLTRACGPAVIEAAP